jgi:hypothetical protein
MKDERINENFALLKRLTERLAYTLPQYDMPAELREHIDAVSLASLALLGRAVTALDSAETLIDAQRAIIGNYERQIEIYDRLMAAIS